MLRSIRWRLFAPLALALLITLLGLGVYLSGLLRAAAAQSPAGVLSPEVLAQIRQKVWIASLIAGGALLVVAVYVADRAARRLENLTGTALQIARRDAAPGAPAHTQDEIGRLAHAIDLMAQRLNRQIEARESERGKLAAILRQMTNGVVMIDPEGRVGLLNAAAERMFDVQESAAVGRSLVEVLRHHQLAELWQASRTSGQMREIELEIPHKRLYLQAIATPLDGLMRGHTLLVFQDLTRLRQLETVRQDFISNISHELRTPLASLKALTETLLDGALDDPPAARRFLTRIDTEVDALFLMVQELLELARIESGRVPLQFQPIQPLTLITSAVERLYLQAERAGLEVTVACPDDLPLVRADPPRMQQVLMNLLHNAIKFTPPGGKIFMRARRNPSQPEEVIFEVADTGVGIPPDDLPRIFERFYKADRSRSGGGTGLGLAIARHLVESHQGRIWVESVQGEGSRFFFSLRTADESNRNEHLT